MAVSDAVRRSGSLLLRALAVGGLATAAWFVCAGVASAGEDHSNEIAKTLDVVNVTLGEQQAATTDLLLADVLPQHATPFTSAGFPHAHRPSEPPAYKHHPVGVDFHPTNRPLVLDHSLAVGCPLVVDRPPEFDRPSLDVGFPPSQGGHPADDDSYPGSYPYPYPDDDPYPDDTEYSHSGYSHSGSVSNTMPAPLYEAKVAAKASTRAAAAAASTPPAAAPAPAEALATAPTRAGVLPLDVFVPAAPAAQITSNAVVIWEVPEPTAPAPAPTQAPAPSVPTASSSSADNGGGHRGGVIASFTSQSDPKPLTAWSVERRDDGRSPGSIPGLPSTSPD
ncbi:hypothetical protein ALI22I_40795 [Saccharothrix sp. ALI-22-I]|uniref:hypothetical protein n=1 Tax=Saccharothrix sp. ALI-22-I TaxID=1933778 RepID=UPI00097BC00A|nr:hypothetical protein [Saccharothrix sp. ALI-22-I]ONI82429.1 hypothetical protein ALI22I_40795 [Saccharothrix sp. ALI-22-I]